MRVTNVAEFLKLVAEGGALNTMEVVGDTAILATADASGAAGAGAAPIGGPDNQAAQGSNQGSTHFLGGGDAWVRGSRPGAGADRRGLK